MARTRGSAHRTTDADRRPSTTRCVLVWTVVSSVLGATASLCLGELLRTARAPAAQVVVAEQSVVLVACVAGLWASLHVWVVASLAVLDTLRGRLAAHAPGAAATARGARPGTVRRLTLLACGVAVSAGAALPSYAAEPDSGASGLSVLDGLPYPDRASTRERFPASDEEVVVHRDAPRPRPGPTADTDPPGARATARHEPRAARAETLAEIRTVHHGDSLWAIAAELAGSQDASVVVQRVDELHRTNRAVIGDDPDLILPGQRLRAQPPPPTQDRTTTSDRSQEGPR